METKNKKRGKYGSSETYNDETISKDVVSSIYQYLTVFEVFKDWEYCLIEKGITEDMYYRRDMQDNYPSDFIPHRIETDFPSIILRNKANKDDWYLIVSGDDKYQDTEGNAIERAGKNYLAAIKMCFNSDICPYILCCSGDSFIEKDGTPNEYFNSKFREMFPYTKNGVPSIWNTSDKKGSFKNAWNRVYLSKERFTKEEKTEIVKDVVQQSISYLRCKLENN